MLAKYGWLRWRMNFRCETRVGEDNRRKLLTYWRKTGIRYIAGHFDRWYRSFYRFILLKSENMGAVIDGAINHGGPSRYYIIELLQRRLRNCAISREGERNFALHWLNLWTENEISNE